ncbi:MAG: nucleotidyltransferase family protein [Spirochaetota bacterium]
MVEARDCDAILLAAGLSSRMAGSKMLREIDGLPLVRLALEHACAACGRGHEAAAVRAALGELSSRVVVVENHHYRDGMLGSIQTGMREVESDWFFVVPGDMPRLDREIFSAVAHAAPPDARAPAPTAADAAAPTGPLAVVPYYREVRGHPVLVSRTLVPALLREPRSAGPMRNLLARYPTARIHLDRPEITLDLDTDRQVERFTSGERSSRRGHEPE